MVAPSEGSVITRPTGFPLRFQESDRIVQSACSRRLHTYVAVSFPVRLQSQLPSLQLSCFQLLRNTVSRSKVHLVRSLAFECRVWQVRIMLSHVECDQLPHTGHRVQRIQKQLLVLDDAPLLFHTTFWTFLSESTENLKRPKSFVATPDGVFGRDRLMSSTKSSRGPVVKVGEYSAWRKFDANCDGRDPRQPRA